MKNNILYLLVFVALILALSKCGGIVGNKNKGNPIVSTEPSSAKNTVAIKQNKLVPNTNYTVDINDSITVFSADSNLVRDKDTLYIFPKVIIDTNMFFEFLTRQAFYLNKNRITFIDANYVQYLILEEFNPIDGNYFHIITIKDGKLFDITKTMANYYGNLDNDSAIELGGFKYGEENTEIDKMKYQSVTIYKLTENGIIIDTALTKKYTINVMGFYKGITEGIIFIPILDSLK